MKFSIRRRAWLQTGLCSLATTAAGAHAQSYPNRPVKLIVGFAAGGPTDAAARIVAPELSARLGQQVVVDNRPGAAGIIGADAVAASAPDGYTLGMLAVTSAVSEALAGKVFATHRLEPISLMYDQYNVLLVNPAFPGLAKVRTLNDLLARARASAAPMNFTSAGHGSMGHLTMAWINSLAGVQMNHVPYKGAAPALTDVLGGQLGVMFGDSASAAPHIRSGKLVPVAVSYPERVPDLPEVPTVAQQGFPAVSGVPWVVLFGPAGLPRSIVDRVNADLRSSYARPEAAERLRALKVTPRTSTPEAARSLIENEYAAWKKVSADNHLKAD